MRTGIQRDRRPLRALLATLLLGAIAAAALPGAAQAAEPAPAAAEPGSLESYDESETIKAFRCTQTGPNMYLYSSGDPEGFTPPNPPSVPILGLAELLPTRIAGADRYATAAAVAGQWGELFGRPEVVYVATGENFPDALAASPAAVYSGGPLLLTAKKKLPAVVKARLDQLRPERIVLLGSTAAVSKAVLEELKGVAGSPEVLRIAGADRYATMREILKHAWGVDGDGVHDAGEDATARIIILATGRNYPDALAAAAAAGIYGGAVVLVDGTKKSVPPETLRLIEDLRPERIYIAGSPEIVKCSIQKQVEAEFPETGVKRFPGLHRYQTAGFITSYFASGLSFTGGAAFVTTGHNYPDALAGAALAGALGMPLVLARQKCFEENTALIRNTLDSHIVLLGSSKVLSSQLYKLKGC